MLYSLQQKRLVHFYLFNPFIYQLKKFVSLPCMSNEYQTAQMFRYRDADLRVGMERFRNPKAGFDCCIATICLLFRQRTSYTPVRSIGRG